MKIIVLEYDVILGSRYKLREVGEPNVTDVRHMGKHNATQYNQHPGAGKTDRHVRTIYVSDAARARKMRQAAELIMHK